MLDCAAVREELSAYIDNELPSAKRQEIEQHLQRCKGCYDEYIELQVTSAIMHSLRELEPPPGFRDKVAERLRKEENRGIWRKVAKKPWYSLGAAAGILLLIGAWGLWFDGGWARFPVDLTGQAEIAQEDASTVGEAVEMQLFAGDIASEERAAGMEAAGKTPEQNAGAAVAWDEPVIEKAEAPEPSPPPAGEDENRVFEVALRSLPPEAVGETPPDHTEAGAGRDEIDKPEADARALVLQGAPPGGEGLVIEISLTTEAVEQSRHAVESLAYRNGLGVARHEENGITVLVMLVPIHLQRSIIEQLRGTGFVTGEVLSNPELGERINELSRSQEELWQQQSELNALIASGGALEETQVWEEELAKVQAQLKEIEGELQQLEEELPPSEIKIILKK
ncbi:MAG TPA: hypothetical protein GXX34_02530 [Clostridia bacterium]|nr:hypothetical protein [Clostridia bacterium]